MAGPDVEYALADWSAASREALGRLLDEHEIHHLWVGGTLVVLARDEEDVDRLVDRIDLVLEHPFDPNRPAVRWELDGWTEGQRASLGEALVDAGLASTWAARTVLAAYEEDEAAVDRVIDELYTRAAGAEQLLDALGEACDRILVEVDDPHGLISATDVASELLETARPFAFEAETWSSLHAVIGTLRHRLTSGVGDDAVRAAADEVRRTLRATRRRW